MTKSYRSIYEVEGEKLVIKLPKHLLTQKKVWVTVDEVSDSHDAKLHKLSGAATDPLFQADVDEISLDFRQADADNA
ncbi:MAG: hypothetical protein MUC38_00790 [Cyclobacteriaceae bacterium]|nr:hypothetical protein [Cyclobacteriaceae bacterium]